MITAGDIVLGVAKLAGLEAQVKIGQAMHDDLPEGICVAGEEELLQARTDLADGLERWRVGADWPHPARQSPHERVQHDPVFRSIVSHLLGCLRAGAGHFTPTELREAVVYAAEVYERERPIAIELQTRPPAKPTPPPTVRPSEESTDDGTK